MKLVFHGHDERYAVEQSLMSLFPGELPVYEPIGPDDDTWAVISLEEAADTCRVRVELCYRGAAADRRLEAPLTGSDFDREGQRRHTLARCFFLAARDAAGIAPPWGMLTGVRPDKPVTWALAAGKTPDQAREMLESEYFVTPERGGAGHGDRRRGGGGRQGPGTRDIAVYVGIPFCPTRCAYCSFVSQSVEKSFSLVPPYVEALVQEITAGGAHGPAAGTCGSGPSTWAAAPPPP